MREIKFRVFDDVNFGTPNMRHFNVFQARFIDHIEKLKIMQFTGLKDNNGKEIYEGDICTIWMGCKQDKPYLVEDMRELYADINNSDSYLRITEIEVIGNIHANPELIKGGAS